MCSSMGEHLPSILMAEVQSIDIGKREIIKMWLKRGYYIKYHYNP